MEPNFAEYSLEELLEVKENLDKEKYPERYARIIGLISSYEQSSNGSKSQQIHDSEEALRYLFREYKKEKLHIWNMIRGAVLMFVAFRVMQYLEWSTSKQIVGGFAILVTYTLVLVLVNEYKFSRFKNDFLKQK